LRVNTSQYAGQPTTTHLAFASRLTGCPASEGVSQQTRELGQVAHETSQESERGLLIHKAYELQSADGLSASSVGKFYRACADIFSAPVGRVFCSDNHGIGTHSGGFGLKLAIHLRFASDASAGGGHDAYLFMQLLRFGEEDLYC
jgi:hypothetical protein